MADPEFKNYFTRGEWLKDLFDNAHDLIQIVLPEGTLVYVNRSWSKLLGYRMDEIEGRSIYDFIAIDDRELYRNYRESAMNSQAQQEVEFRLQKNNGETVYVEGFVSARLEGDRLVYTTGIFRDITARHQNEARLRQLNLELQEREYNVQQLLKNAPDAIIVIDAESRIILWNPKAEDIFGWKAEEVLNHPLAETIIPPQHREAHAKGMNRFLTTGISTIMHRTVEITALNRTGNEFHIALTIAPSQHAGGTSFIAFIRDITEQKNNQLDLYKKTLELERTNSNLEEFAYAASHDLKEPIRKIHMFSERLKDRLQARLEPEDLMLFDRMGHATVRMRNLIDDLLTYSSVSSGRADLSEVNLNTALSSVLDDLELVIQEKSAEIHVEVLPTIQGNSRQLQQLFQNLIGNSLKYSKPDVTPQVRITVQQLKGSALTISVSAEEQEKDFYLIKVMDNGIGFEQQDAEKIFNVFTRLYGEPDKKGTGIGLSIVRKVAENHGGYIMAEGRPGAGACFYVILPK